MTNGGAGGVTSDGHYSGPPGGPLIVVPTGGSPNLLPLPPTVTQDATHDQRKRLDIIQLEYARDIARLQSRAYEAALKALSPREDDVS